MNKVTAIDAVRQDAGLFLHRLDLVQSRALFVRVAEKELRAASFLDERLGIDGREAFWLPIGPLLDEARDTGESAQAPSFIFHIGHCGSTLLSRLLDLSAGVLGLREPLALRELAVAERDRESPLARVDPQRLPMLSMLVMRLLGRKFQRNQRVVVKATSNCNILAERLLAEFPDVRTVLLYLPLERYLATMLKAPNGARDALTFAPDRLCYLHRRLGEDGLRLYRLAHAETLALGWMAELLRFHEVSQSGSGDRAMMLDFENLLAAPEAQLAAVCEHLRLPGVPTPAASTAMSDVLRAYAKKPDHAYSPADREHDLALSRRKFGNDIALGLEWAEHLIARHPQLESLAPLLGRAR
ncbi:MAG: hypothetical protein WBV61_08435 [Rhodanobacteraceae bacterium]